MAHKAAKIFYSDEPTNQPKVQPVQNPGCNLNQTDHDDQDIRHDPKLQPSQEKLDHTNSGTSEERRNSNAVGISRTSSAAEYSDYIIGQTRNTNFISI